MPTLLRTLLRYQAAVLSHLSAITLFLGFHTLGLYVHNDAMTAFGSPESLIAVWPVYVQWIQLSHGRLIAFEISSGDLLVHHAIALGLHVTTLVAIKASLSAVGSKLMPDKVSFGFGFPCDGPGRGGTCDISSWDGIYLAAFWMLNTIGWITFYWHWKHISIRGFFGQSLAWGIDLPDGMATWLSMVQLWGWSSMATLHPLSRTTLCGRGCSYLDI